MRNFNGEKKKEVEEGLKLCIVLVIYQMISLKWLLCLFKNK